MIMRDNHSVSFNYRDDKTHKKNKYSYYMKTRKKDIYGWSEIIYVDGVEAFSFTGTTLLGNLKNWFKRKLK